jgi:hypothetical protein
MNMKIPTIVVSIMVAIVLIAGVLMPVINDVNDPVVATYSNQMTNSVRATLVDTSEDVKLSYDASVSTTNIVVNETTSIDCGGVFGFLTDTASISMGASKVWISANDGVYSRYNTVTSFVANFDDGVMTASIYDTNTGTDEITVTANYNYLYIPDLNGNYVMIDGSGGKTVYINSDDDVAGVTFGNSSMFTVKGDVSKYLDLTTGTVAYTKTAVEGSDDTYTISITQSGGDIAATYDDENGVSRTANVWKIAVPLTIVAHNEETGGYHDILSVIPVIVILSLLVAVVALVFRSRLD